MILKSLKLNNIRSYLSQEIEFPQGSLLLSGDIGAGKSTILQAVEFALFGILRGDLSGTSLLRKGKNSGYVELSFEVDGKKVTIKRALKRLKDSVKQEAGFVIIDDKKHDMTPVELKTKILEQLGYPDELVTKSKSLIYRYTVYTPQEEMKNILFEDKSARLDTLRRVFGIDRYKRIAANAEILIRKIKEEKKGIEGRIFDLDEKIGQKKKLEIEVQRARRKIEEIMPEYNRFREEISSKRSELKDIEGRIIRLNNLKKEFEVNEAKIDALARRKEANVKEVSELQKQIKETNEKISRIKIIKEDFREKEIEDELKKLEAELFNASKKISEATEKLQYHKKQIDDLKKGIVEKSEKSKTAIEKESRLNTLREEVKARAEIEERFDGAEHEILKLTKAVSEYEACKRNALALKDKIKKLDTCPTCFQPVNESHKKMIDLEENKKIETYEKHIEEINERKKEASDTILNLKKQLKEAEEKEKLVERLQAEIEGLQALNREIAEKQNLLSKLVSALPELEKAAKSRNIEEDRKKVEEKKQMLKAVQSQKMLLKEKEMLARHLQDKMSRADSLVKEEKDINESMSGLKKKNSEIDKGIKEFKEVEKKFLDAKNALDEILEKSKSIEIKKAELEKEKQGLEKNLKTLENEVNEKLRIKESLVELSERQHWLGEFFIKLMFLMEKHVMNSVRIEFNELFQKWCSVLIEDEAISAGLDEEFSPVIEQNGHQTDVLDMSGGEKTSCALAYRLALNRVINDLMSAIKTKDIIILDEPTDGFSTEQLDKVRDVLEQLNANQVIIVSHEPKLESFVQNILRVQKEGHVSRIIY